MLENEIPYSKEAEEGIVTAALVNPAVVPIANLKPEDFHHVHLGELWTHILEGVTEPLKLSEVSKISYSEVLRLYTAVANTAFVESYSDIIKDRAMRRRSIRVAQRITKDAMANSEFVPANYVEALTSVAVTDAVTRPFADAVIEFELSVAERMKDPKEIYGIDVGFADWNKATAGLQRQQLQILAGEPGVGKTVMFMQMCVHMSYDIPGAVFELEMSEKDLVSRLVAAGTGIATKQMFSGYVQKSWDVMKAEMRALERLPIFLSVSPAISTADIRSEVARLKVAHNIGWIAIDSLALLNDNVGAEEYVNIGVASTRLRAICKEFDVAGLAVHNLTKEGQNSRKLTGLAGSAKVGYGADVVAFMSQYDGEEELTDLEKDNMRTIEFMKQRHQDSMRIFHLVKKADLPAFMDYAYRPLPTPSREPVHDYTGD